MRVSVDVASAPTGAGFVPGDPVSANLRHYAVFYAATSLGYDLPRAVLTCLLVLLLGGRVLAALRRAVRKANFDATATFEPAGRVT